MRKGLFIMLITEETKQKIASANRANTYVDITPYELGISFPIVNYIGFHPAAGEILIYAAPATTFKDKEQVVGYTGKSAGVSVRVAKGMSVRTGGTGSKAIRDAVRQANMGDLLITNKRIMFVGKDDSFEFKVDKISTVKLLDKNSFIIQSGRSSKNVWLDSALIAYGYGLINYAINQNAQDTDVYAVIQEERSKVTKEQLDVCNQVRQECSAIKQPVPKAKKKQGCLWGVAKFMWILVAVVAIGGIIAVQMAKNSVNDNSVAEANKYTLNDILYLENHPIIYDSYEEAREFYDGIGAVKVVTIQQHSQIEKKLKKVTDDENLIYFIQHSTHDDFTGTIQINLYDESVSKHMAVDKAAELMVSYLPDNFFECYSKDSSYKYTNGNTTVYVYSCRFNDTGAAYHNDGHGEYSYYYSFRIIHFKDTNQWKLETDYAAYGGKGLEWIENYSDEWDVDFKDYLG